MPKSLFVEYESLGDFVPAETEPGAQTPCIFCGACCGPFPHWAPIYVRDTGDVWFVCIGCGLDERAKKQKKRKSKKESADA